MNSINCTPTHDLVTEEMTSTHISVFVTIPYWFPFNLFLLVCTGYVTPDLHFNLTSPDSGVSLYDTKAVKRITKYGGDKRGVSLYHKTFSRGLVDIGKYIHILCLF